MSTTLKNTIQWVRKIKVKDHTRHFLTDFDSAGNELTHRKVNYTCMLRNAYELSDEELNEIIKNSELYYIEKEK
jgi:hypothetical protein